MTISRRRFLQYVTTCGATGALSALAAPGLALAQSGRPVLRAGDQKGGLRALLEAADALRLSARGYHRVLRVARTLADLDGTEKVERSHLAEALSYRTLADSARAAA